MPLVIKKDGFTLAIAESDVHHYPQLRFAYPTNTNAGACAYFAKYPKAVTLPAKGIAVTYRAAGTEEFIAKTVGGRDFPWRAFIVARNDADLADNETVFKLASPCAVADTSWISGSMCAWHLFFALIEDTDFPVGMNEKTARYYVDYASANGLGYVLIDAGWLTNNPHSNCYFYTPDMDQAFGEDRRVLDVEKIATYALQGREADAMAAGENLLGLWQRFCARYDQALGHRWAEDRFLRSRRPDGYRTL